MRANARLHRAFDDAERQRQCLRAHDRGLRRMLERRHRSGEVLLIMPKLYARPDYWNALPSSHERIMHVLRAECATHPAWTLGGVSAATVWRLTDSAFLNRMVHWATETPRAATEGGHYAFRTLPEVDAVAVEGLRVTNLRQTLFDCARSLPPADALPILESALRSGAIARADLLSFLDGRRGHKGIGAARSAVGYANGLSENGGEAVSLGRLVEWGYAVPEQQVECVEPVTGARRRVDFLWRRDDGVLIIGELDGRGKHADPAMADGRDVERIALAERERESNLAPGGSAVLVRWSFEQLVRQPDLVRRRLDLAGVPKAGDGEAHGRGDR